MNISVGIMTAPHISCEQRPQGVMLRDVRIGIGFHWDSREDQLFEGIMDIRRNADGTETAINTLDIEDYLTSVITSEMAATSSLELLKAHAIISRSWAIRRIDERQKWLNKQRDGLNIPHLDYDVCADDHCQRYNGITRRDEQAETAARVRQAVNETRGMVLVDPTENNTICDTRYHKCCGGRTELFENVWENRHYSYLESVACPYCNTSDARILRQVLTNYDQETPDFYSWQVQYTAEELSDIIRDKSGIDFGDITDLVPLKRGVSGRIYELKIVGTGLTKIIGKELTIRQWLSRSCLYSSAFDIERYSDNNGTTRFILHGKGWGHGVGLCQIGAAVMAEQGADYKQILEYYYKGAEICQVDQTT